MSQNKEEFTKDTLISFVETPPEIAQLMVTLISQKKKKNSLILDTGCGKGIFLEALLEAGFQNVEGIELNFQLFNFCKKKFPQITLYRTDFLTWNPPKKYDVIIGNPPYAHYNQLPEFQRKKVAEITKTKESDIYYAFIIKAINLLKERGELIYIVPYGFLYNTFAKNVRKKLTQEGYLTTLIDLDEIRLFQGENPETLIFKFVKNRQRNTELDKAPKLTILRVKRINAKPHEIKVKALEALCNKQDNDLFHIFSRQTFSDFSNTWSTHPHFEIEHYVLLKDVAFVGVGLVSGYDSAFRINTAEETQKFTDKEKKTIFKFIKAAHCKGYWVDGYTHYILLDDQISSEQEFKEHYPNIFKRFLPFKEQMSTRYLPKSKKWFQWQALRNKTTYEKYLSDPKIFVPTLDRSKTNRFSMSMIKAFPAGDVLAIIPLKINPYFLLGYLNSNFFRNYYLSSGGRRGGRMAYTQRLIANVKIPVMDKKTINGIIHYTKKIIEEKDQSLRTKIDELIESTITII